MIYSSLGIEHTIRDKRRGFTEWRKREKKMREPLPKEEEAGGMEEALDVHVEVALSGGGEPEEPETWAHNRKSGREVGTKKDQKEGEQVLKEEMVKGQKAWHHLPSNTHHRIMQT